MKTMKRFAARICALFVVLTVSLTALVPAAFAATKAQLPDLPSSQCVVDDANILSSSTKTAIEVQISHGTNPLGITPDPDTQLSCSILCYHRIHGHLHMFFSPANG